MDFDLSEYMGAYIDGSRENLDTMDRMLLMLEENPGNLEAIEEIFRAAHTLKGMSATMGFEKVAHLTHEMESILDKLRNHVIPVSADVIDVVFETFDVLRTLVNDSIQQTDSNVDLDQIVGKLHASGSGQPSASAGAESEFAPSEPDPGETETDGGASAGYGEGNSGILADLAEISITEFESGGLIDAIQGGLHVFLVKVQLVADCLLKGPRIFMVLRTLDALNAEIAKALPEVKDLENEKFDTSFKMVIQTDHSGQEVATGIESISEIDVVEVIPLTMGDLRGEASSGPVTGASMAGSGASPPAPLAPSVSPPPQPAPPPPPPAARQTVARQAVPVSAPAPVREPAPETVEALPESEDDEPPPAPPSPPPEAPSGYEGETLAEERERESIELVQLVSFRMAGETYALEIKLVESIINLIPMTRVPKAQKYYDGVVNLRGEIVPVINLRQRLRLPLKERTSEDQIIILVFEEEKVKVGFLVDHVHEVLRIPGTSIEPPSHVSESVEVEHLKGVGKIDSKIIILLNAHRIVFG